MTIHLSLIGLLLVAASALLLRRLVRSGAPLRRGPWPGLTLHGAGVLLTLALMLGGTQLALGAADLQARERAALPYVPLAAAGSLIPLVLAGLITGLPGAASAACGAYLLPRSLVSLLLPHVAPPLLLLPSAMLLDLVLWTRRADLVELTNPFPRRGKAALRHAWRVRERGPRALSVRRATVAGGLYGLLLAVLEPPHALLLGSPASLWTPGAVLSAALGASILCALVARGIVQAPYARRSRPR